MIRTPRIDVHVHLAGIGTQGSGCWASPAFRRRPTFLGLRALYRIGNRQLRTTVDQDWPALISALTGESELDASVVLGFDGVYDAQGELDRRRSQLVVPPEWVFEVCERYDNLLPGPSINPLRRDALDHLEMCIERGAVLIKWLPIVQGFSPADRRVRPFVRRAAEAGIPLLVHAGGGEVTFATVDPTVGHVKELIPLLEEGATVICAHAAAPVVYRRETSEIPLLRRLIRRFSSLWIDDSGLANPSRFPYLTRLAHDPELAGRTLHGSDFPVISSALYYPRRVGIRAALRIEREHNPLQKEILVKRAVGIGDDSLTRPARVLANLDRWLTP